ncbi:hypothetical protein Tco_0264880 [Tanacetum coccineum]
MAVVAVASRGGLGGSRGGGGGDGGYSGGGDGDLHRISERKCLKILECLGRKDKDTKTKIKILEGSTRDGKGTRETQHLNQLAKLHEL